MKKIIFNMIKLVFIIILLLYVVFPIGIGLYATFKFNKSVGNTPEGFRNISLKTSDNVTLSSWYAPSKNGAVIILIHGSTSSRDSIRKHAEMLVENEFGVLAFDMRGHGESTGDGATAYNWNGTQDVKAAVDYLLTQDDVKHIGGLGLSLGGEVLLGAVSSNKEIKAVVSDGASYRTIDDYLILPSNRSFVRSYTTKLMYLSVKVISNVEEPIRIIDSIDKAKDTSFLFIASENVKKEIEYNTYFNNLIKDRSQLWIIKDANHIQGINIEKENYTKNVVDFFNTHLIAN